jgi:hypothetical protein
MVKAGISVHFEQGFKVERRLAPSEPMDVLTLHRRLAHISVNAIRSRPHSQQSSHRAASYR